MTEGVSTDPKQKAINAIGHAIYQYSNLREGDIGKTGQSYYNRERVSEEIRRALIVGTATALEGKIEYRSTKADLLARLSSQGPSFSESSLRDYLIDISRRAKLDIQLIDYNTTQLSVRRMPRTPR